MRGKLIANWAELKKLRQEAWLLQRELAEQAGVSRNTVSRIETGKSRHPSRETIRALAKALDVRPNTLAIAETSGGKVLEFKRPR